MYVCVCLESRRDGEEIEFFCSSFALLASVVLNLYRDKRKKLHINMSGRIIDDVRF